MNMTRYARSQNGFSLLEALIAVLILSIGVLGVTALQYTSKRANHEAIQRLTATNLVRELAERMRLNREQLGEYADFDKVWGGVEAAPATDCRAADCSPTQLAAFDLWEWNEALIGVSEQRVSANVGGLVQPSGCIIGQTGPGVYSITIAWRGSESLQDQPGDDCRLAAGIYGTGDRFRRFITEHVYIR